MDYNAALNNLYEDFKGVSICEANIQNNEKQLQQLSNQYENMQLRKPSLFVQSIIIFLVGFIIIISIRQSEPNFKFIFSGVLILAIILNCIRAHTKYTRRNRAADRWWETTGKPQALCIKNAINSAKSELSIRSENLRNNPLYNEIPNYFRNLRDIDKIYNYILKYNIDLKEAVYMHLSLENAKAEREEARNNHKELIDTLEGIRRGQEAAAKAAKDEAERREFEETLWEQRYYETKYH